MKTTSSLKAKAPDGWTGLIDRGTQLLLDVRINEELAREGMAREVVRHVQELRKKSGLEMEDRIVLHFATESPALRRAVEGHSSYISAETLAVKWANIPLDGDCPHDQRESGRTSINDTVAQGDRGEALGSVSRHFWICCRCSRIRPFMARFFSVLKSGVFS